MVLLAAGWAAPRAWAAGEAPGGWPWWVLPIALFGLTSLLGVLAALAGVGGGVLFVPIVSGFAPFLHLDFVRGTGLLVALTGALAAGPKLIQANLVDLRLAIPVSLMASLGSMVGAWIGLALPLQAVQISLGAVILCIVAVMLLVRPRRPSGEAPPGMLGRALGIEGRYFDEVQGRTATWHPRSLTAGLLLFTGVGLMAGMFGLGAGWANVPVLNLVMGVPLRIAVATSYFLLALTDTTAALVYFNRGAILPLITVPSILGIMIGARAGSWLLMRLSTGAIRWVVLSVLVVAGLRAVLRGFGI